MEEKHDNVGFDHLLGRLKLAKVWLCLLVGLSALFGFLMAAGKFSFSGGSLALGIFFLAMGGATLNSWQEKATDSKMTRTRKRPMVRGEFSGGQALMQATLLLTVGTVLAAIASISAALFALIGLILYNLIYTPLKKKSLLAIFPGAVCGAVPPCAGWLAGGGGIDDYRFWLLFVLFFLWQIPHFWLVMLMHREDYIGGPYPSLLDIFPDGVVKGFFLPWVGSLLIAMLLFSLLPGEGYAGTRWLVILNCLLLGGMFLFQLVRRKRPAYKVLFIALNLSLMVHMGVISLASLLH